MPRPLLFTNLRRRSSFSKPSPLRVLGTSGSLVIGIGMGAAGSGKTVAGKCRRSRPLNGPLATGLQGSQGWLWAEGSWIVPTPPATVTNQAPGTPEPAAQAAPPAGPEVVVTQAPPAPIIESIPLCPGPDFVWIGGSWAWRGSWVWTSGYYYRRPVGQVAWVPGYWGHRTNGWVWMRGRWR